MDALFCRRIVIFSKRWNPFLYYYFRSRLFRRLFAFFDLNFIHLFFILFRYRCYLLLFLYFVCRYLFRSYIRFNHMMLMFFFFFLNFLLCQLFRYNFIFSDLFLFLYDVIAASKLLCLVLVFKHPQGTFSVFFTPKMQRNKSTTLLHIVFMEIVFDDVCDHV